MTSALDPLSKERVESALTALAKAPGFADRMAWWAKDGFSCERWVQFELAYHLEQFLQPDFAVGCERHRRDILIYPTSSPRSEQRYIGVIELKWFANWYTREGQRDSLAKDICKITDDSNASRPALAMCVFLVARPDQADGDYSWIEDQIKDKKWGVRSLDELRKRWELPKPRDWEIGPIEFDHGKLGESSLWGWGWRNAVPFPASGA